MTNKPKTIDEYLAKLDDRKRAALQKLRERIRRAAPDAEECLSYQQPAFRQGRMLVGFGAAKQHCAFYLMSGTVLGRFAEEVGGLDVSKGTIRFQPERPLPARLVTKLVKARLAENAARDERR